MKLYTYEYVEQLIENKFNILLFLQNIAMDTLYENLIWRLQLYTYLCVRLYRSK